MTHAATDLTQARKKFWQRMTRAQKIAYVRPLAQQGYSAGDIVTSLEGATRNMIVGLCARQGIKLKGFAHPLKSTPAPDIYREHPDTWRPLGNIAPISLLSGTPKRCAWPVDGGFCGEAATKRLWCEVHSKMGHRAARAGE